MVVTAGISRPRAPLRLLARRLCAARPRATYGGRRRRSPRLRRRHSTCHRGALCSYVPHLAGAFDQQSVHALQQLVPLPAELPHLRHEVEATIPVAIVECLANLFSGLHDDPLARHQAEHLVLANGGWDVSPRRQHAQLLGALAKRAPDSATLEGIPHVNEAQAVLVHLHEVVESTFTIRVADRRSIALRVDPGIHMQLLGRVAGRRARQIRQARVSSPVQHHVTCSDTPGGPADDRLGRLRQRRLCSASGGCPCVQSTMRYLRSRRRTPPSKRPARGT